MYSHVLLAAYPNQSQHNPSRTCKYIWVWCTMCFTWCSNYWSLFPIKKNYFLTYCFQQPSIEEPIHVISTIDAATRTEKPPDYNELMSSELDASMQPPSYDDAIKLNPALLPYSLPDPAFSVFGYDVLPPPPPPPPPHTRPSSSAGILTIENLETTTCEVIDEKHSEGPSR